MTEQNAEAQCASARGDSTFFVEIVEIPRQDPLSGGLFVFCNRRWNILKILYWERNGFCLWLKKRCNKRTS